MMNKNIAIKFNMIVYGALIPIIMYVGITFLVALVVRILYPNIENSSILLMSFANVILIFIYIPYYRYILHKHNISINRFSARNLLYIISIGFAVCVMCNVLLQFLPSTKDNIVSKEIMKLMEEYNIIVVLLIVSIIVPIVEELLFRGFIYDTFCACFNPLIAIIASSLLFAAAHGNIEQGIYAIIAGGFLGYIRYRYNSVTYTVFMHLIMNFASICIVPVTLMSTDYKHIAFMVFICVCLVIVTIYRIENIYKNKGEL